MLSFNIINIMFLEPRFAFRHETTAWCRIISITIFIHTPLIFFYRMYSERQNRLDVEMY